MNFIKRIVKHCVRAYENLKRSTFYSRCFARQEYDGIAVFGMCCGPQNPEFVILEPYPCADCPYYTGNLLSPK